MSGITPLPGSFAFAFALILTRSKPSGITVEDYVLALRKSSSIQDSSVPGSLFVDRSKLLQQLFHLNQQSNLYLRGEGDRDTQEVELNKQTIGIKRKLRSDSTADPETNNRLKRQKALPSCEIATKNQHKHREEQHNDRTLLLQMTFQLNRMTREPPLDSTDFLSAIFAACNAILQTSKNAQHTRIADRSSRSQVPMLNEACQAAGRVWSAIMSNLEAGKANSCARRELVPLAIPMSSIVRSLLGQLRHHCLSEAARRQNELSCGTSSNTGSLKRRSRNSTIHFELFEHNTNVITRFLIHIMLTATRLHTRQQGIFHAVAGVFLQHVGESMRLHLFGDLSNGCTKDPAGLVSGIFKASSVDVGLEKSAAQIEAPHLVEILRTFVQALVPENLGCVGSEVITNLQKTLVRGIFGGENESVPLFTHSAGLMDQESVNDIDYELAHNKDGEDWFLTQVWELLGWDILIG